MQYLSPRLRELAPLTDAEVVVRVLSGDAAVFELLMRRYNQRLFRLARAVVGEEAEAEDVVQDAYLKAYSALPKFRGDSSVATWLSRIVLNESLRVKRKKQRAPLASAADLERCESAPSERTPLEALEHEELMAAVVAALDELPVTQRTVCMLRLVEGLSTRETAEVLELSEANVKVILYRAKHELADVLDHRSEGELRQVLAFAGDRCNRIVASVFARLQIGDPSF